LGLVWFGLGPHPPVEEYRTTGAPSEVAQVGLGFSRFRVWGLGFGV
jgi:hypothetical protein